MSDEHIKSKTEHKIGEQLDDMSATELGNRIKH